MSRNIAVAAPEFSGNEWRYVRECIETSWVSSIGRFITEFEAALANYLEVDHVVVTNNGTTALHLSLVALGVGPGDEVIVPTLTYVATANAATYCGATPVLVDVDPHTMLIDPDEVRRRIGPRTKAVVPVHLYGHGADMESLSAVVGERGIPLVEDAAEAFGARVAGRRAGSIGACGTFSFFGNKIITTGEGGAVTTRDGRLAERLRLYRGQGMGDQRYWFPVVGYNYRMTNVAAAIGMAQLEQVDKKLDRRREIAAAYDRLLGDADGVATPAAPPWSESVHWLYTVQVDVERAEQRDEIARRLAADGIESRPVFYPMHQMPPYFQADGHFPNADRLAARGLSLPTHTLLDEQDITWVSERLLHHVRAVRNGS